MESFVIEGGHLLSGEITPQGAKNEALEVICATLLTSEPVRIENVPDILDVNNLIRLHFARQESTLDESLRRLGKLNELVKR